MFALPEPPLDAIASLGHSEYERDFLRREFEPGLQYYADRLRRLMFAGGRLLDAGCGAGQWSLAASPVFERVDAFDINLPRLDVTRRLARQLGIRNVAIAAGSIESLPYAPESFDAILCYGVIVFTDIAATLEQFNRVLKPGGRVYVCLSADGWSHFLIRERGPAEPRVADIGRQTLYNAYWRRASQRGIARQLRRVLAQLREMHPRGAALRRLTATDSQQLARRSLLSLELGQQLFGQVESFCGPEFVTKLLADAWVVATDDAAPQRSLKADALLPNELEALTEQAGFEAFQWSIEGGLTCDWLQPPLAPKYEGYYEGHLSVWEAMFVKPDTRPAAAADLSRHELAAIAARSGRLFLEPGEVTVLSNASVDTFPRELFERARRIGVRLGGSKYLDLLVKAATTGATSEADAMTRLLEFVQRSIFRDPVSQPLTADGGMPDPLTILMSARGRCSHTTALLIDVFTRAGLEARPRQLTNHVIAEVKVDGRWVIADADAFKNGIVLRNRGGQLLSLDDVRDDPYQLDRYQPTGWWIRPGSRFTTGATGRQVTGYVDALDPAERGFVSGYYNASARGYPPPLPLIDHFEVSSGRLIVEWKPARDQRSRDVRYRVAVGSASRGWTYDAPGMGDQIRRTPQRDVCYVETAETRVDVPIDATAPRLYVSVTACNERVEVEPETFFWPSEEVVVDR